MKLKKSVNMYNVQNFNYSSSPPTLTYCGFSDEINSHTIFWIEGVLLSVVGWIGVLGNMLTWKVLSKIPSKSNIFNNFLMQLVSGDSISIILLFVDYSLRKGFKLFSLEDTTVYGSIWPNIIYPFIKISYTWIMCCTIAITIERYRAICYPFLARQDADELSMRGSVSRRRYFKNLRHMEPARKRLYRYTFLVLMISVLSNIPSFFEFQSGFDEETQLRRIQVTSLRVDEHYIFFYKNVFEGIVLMILPLIAMVGLNARIIYTLNQGGRTVIGGFGRFRTVRRMRNEMNLGRVLVTMDVVFLICNLGRVIINIWEIFHIGQLKECLEIGLPYKIPPWISTLMSLNHFLHVLSASLNLVIISITGSQFRKTLLQLLNFKKKEEITRDSNRNSMRSRAPTNQSLDPPPTRKDKKGTFEMRKVTFNAMYVTHTEESSVQIS